MKRGQLIALGLAGACGLAAMMLANSYMKREPKKVQVTEKFETVHVLVARSDLGLGQFASESSFRWQEWPKDAAARGFITRQARPQATRDLTGAIARSPIMAGEPITESKLIKAGSGGVLAAILPQGMRAISTRIKEETAVGRLILPNDHVDVILIRRQRGKAGGEDHVSETLFRNVRVLAIGQQIEAREGKKGVEGATATLELTPRQAEMLALANSMGEISLSLRSIADLEKGPTADEESGNRKNNAISLLRYGVRSRQYGVN